MPNAVVVFYSSTDTSVEEAKRNKDSDISTVNVLLHIQGGLFNKHVIKNKTKPFRSTNLTGFQ